MLKKSIILVILLGFSTLSIAKNLGSTITIGPTYPWNWGYESAWVDIGSNNYGIINPETFPVSVNDIVSLTDVRYDGRSASIDYASCDNLKITEEGHYNLSFALDNNDDKIYCFFFSDGSIKANK